MATVTFTNAEIDFLVASGPATNWATAAATFTQMDSDSGVVVDDLSGSGSIQVILDIGVPHDDGSVPPVITMTNLHIEFDWAIANVVAAAGDVSWIDADSGATATRVFQTDGSSAAHYTADFDPAIYFGGTDRATLFSAGVVWTHSWVDQASAWTSGHVAVSNYVATVTYTTPVTPVVTSVAPASGSVSGGQAVTITGAGFTSATGVTFGGTAVASYSIVSDTSITAVTPEHLSGVVDVEVLSVATGTGLYTYTVETIRLPPMPVSTPIFQGGGRSDKGRR